jgi:hypothetical protein
VHDVYKNSLCRHHQPEKIVQRKNKRVSENARQKRLQDNRLAKIKNNTIVDNQFRMMKKDYELQFNFDILKAVSYLKSISET